MKVLIHAYPRRMWYVTGFLVPELRRQGADEIGVWNDVEGLGNLRACMAAFASRDGEGDEGTWHVQDDVLLCRDFVARCREHDSGVVYGFCCQAFTDNPEKAGRVSVRDAWHSFQCVRIPDAYARDCAAWLNGDAKNQGDYQTWIDSGKMDDSVFRAYLVAKHTKENVKNLLPCLVEHVDWIVGGSVLHPWRGYLARAYGWEDEDLIRELKEAVKGKVEYVN